MMASLAQVGLIEVRNVFKYSSSAPRLKVSISQSGETVPKNQPLVNVEPMHL